METIKSYAMKFDVIISEDGSRYTKASTRIADVIYTAYGINSEDASASLMHKIMRTDGVEFTELPAPDLRKPIKVIARETTVMVLLWLALAVLATGLFGIVYKILEN